MAPVNENERESGAVLRDGRDHYRVGGEGVGVSSVKRIVMSVRIRWLNGTIYDGLSARMASGNGLLQPSR